MPNIFYFPLEPVKSRYTYQLCNHWIPDSFSDYIKDKSEYKFLPVIPETTEEEVPSDIKVGFVLDAAGRSIFSLKQCEKFVKMIRDGKVENNDYVYLQDFTTPGIESVLYTASLYGITLKIGAMMHANTVDEFDFTYKFKEWLQHSEKMLDAYMSINDGCIFVASTIHKKLLRESNFKARIHVISLPIDCNYIMSLIRDPLGSVIEKNIGSVVFSSRLDIEKNPEFMLAVAKKWLSIDKKHTWNISTSAKELRGSAIDTIEEIKQFAKENERFIINTNLTKIEYYTLLKKTETQFNCSSQDFVSWTLLEAALMGCKICYPNVRSFPECVPSNCLYTEKNIESAINVLLDMKNSVTTYESVSFVSDNFGRMRIPMLLTTYKEEYNIWE